MNDTVDPNAMGMGDPTQPQDQSFGDKLANAASNPLVQMLLGLSKGFGQAAMPTPYRMPFGAVIGSAAGGAAQGLSDAYSMKLAQARAQQMQMQNQLTQAQLPLIKAQTAAMSNVYSNPDLLHQLMTPGGMTQGGAPGASRPGMMPTAGGGGVSPSAMQLALFGTESSGPDSTSSKGAKGTSQIMPATFQSYALPGENFNNDSDRTRVAGRVIDDLWRKYPNDPARVAVGYFSGPGNIAPAGSSTPWIQDRSDGNLTTSQYVQRTLGRLGQGSGQSAASPYVIGDSLGQGVQQAGGFEGQATQGAKPQDILGTLNGMKPGQLAGRDVILSSGASNDPAQVALLDGQIKAAQAKGARTVSVMGVGNRPDLVGLNDQIQTIAGNNGAHFMALPMDQLDKEGVHLSGAGYKAIANGAQQLLPAALPGSTNPQGGPSTMPSGFMQLSPQEAMQQFQYHMGEASRIGLAQQLHLPVMGDPASERATAQEYLKVAMAGPQAQAAGMGKAFAGSFAPFDLRAGGLHWDMAHGWVKNPTILETQDAQGNQIPVHVTPPLPGSAPGTPGEATPIVGPGGQPVVTKLPQQVTEGREKVYNEFLTKDQDAYQAAQNTQGWLNQIDHAADTMNQAGPTYMTGPFAQQRLAAMGGVNDVARSLGISAPFDKNAVAGWEEMRKATTTAGFELASHYEGHARQAASTIMNATTAVPGVSNSPLGLKLVSSGIREGAQSSIDLHEYKQQVANATQGAGLTSAETDFYKAHPAQQYADRAISNIEPFKVANPSDMAKYLPGTFVTTGEISQATGKPKIFQVPSRPEMIGGYPVMLQVPQYMQRQTVQPQVTGAPGG